jgi:hypothetical protein
VVSASAGTLKLNSNEQSEIIWVTEEYSIKLGITEEMMAVIREALQWATNQ